MISAGFKMEFFNCVSMMYFILQIQRDEEMKKENETGTKNVEESSLPSTEPTSVVKDFDVTSSVGKPSKILSDEEKYKIMKERQSKRKMEAKEKRKEEERKRQEEEDNEEQDEK